MKIHCVITLCFGLIPFAIGCGGGTDRPVLANVWGTVTLDGKPLTNGTIIFEAEKARTGTGKIKDGLIVEVTTFETADGLAVGNHKIAVYAQEGNATGAETVGDGKQINRATYMGGGGKSVVAARFNNPATSGLSVVIETGENTINVEVLSK